jgi:hypothetical protein
VELHDLSVIHLRRKKLRELARDERLAGARRAIKDDLLLVAKQIDHVLEKTFLYE